MMSQNPIIKRGLSASTVLLMACAVTACGEDKPAEPPPQPLPTSTAPMPPPPPPEPTVQTGPCDATMQVAMQTAIEARKSDISAGMKKEGVFGCEHVVEGGKLSVAVTLQPGKCYTILANSFPNVSEVDLFLKPNLGPNPNPLVASFAGAVLAQDSETGPIAAVGAGQTCYKNPLPIPGAAMIEVTARTGSGPVAVQVFSK